MNITVPRLRLAGSRAVFAATFGLGAAMSFSQTFEARSRDWRNGAIVYQVFVDRFAPSDHLDAKRGLYAAPRKLRAWSEVPTPSTRDDKQGIYRHELDFWGGDLRSLDSKLDYIRGLGADVVYLNPIFQALTNHKYDTQDYRKIAPEYGTDSDLRKLIGDVHRQGMKIMLDGVFNHMGRTSAFFQEAASTPANPKRDWFYFGKQYPRGYKAWAGVANLPALRLENPQVRGYLWGDSDSIVRHYLKEGIDGWRLDVAYDIGPQFLAEATRAAHAAKPGSVVVGEISGYPADWFPAVDGVYNFYAPYLGSEMLKGAVSGGRAGKMLQDMVRDAGLDNLLKSWLLLDNHDTPRLTSLLPDPTIRHLAQALQFTLPGCPMIYYGSELGMQGAGDPANRAPMRWDRVSDANPDLAWTKRLIALHRSHAALRYGDFKALETDKLLAFARTTDKLADSVIVVLNPTSEVVKETFSTRIGRLMSWGQLRDAISGATLTTRTGLLEIEVKPQTVMILTPVLDRRSGYSPFDRIH